MVTAKELHDRCDGARRAVLDLQKPGLLHDIEGLFRHMRGTIAWAPSDPADAAQRWTL